MRGVVWGVVVVPVVGFLVACGCGEEQAPEQVVVYDGRFPDGDAPTVDAPPTEDTGETGQTGDTAAPADTDLPADTDAPPPVCDPVAGPPALELSGVGEEVTLSYVSGRCAAEPGMVVGLDTRGLLLEEEAEVRWSLTIGEGATIEGLADVLLTCREDGTTGGSLGIDLPRSANREDVVLKVTITDDLGVSVSDRVAFEARVFD